MYSKLYSGQATSTVDMAVYLNSLLHHIQGSFSHERSQINIGELKGQYNMNYSPSAKNQIADIGSIPV
jgi:two-component sensor histidine kinase